MTSTGRISDLKRRSRDTNLVGDDSSEEDAVQITVNGKRILVSRSLKLSYDEVARLAEKPKSSSFSITWKHGKVGGWIAPGQAIDPRDGMSLDVWNAA